MDLKSQYDNLLVIHHFPCMDGLAAAWVLRKKFPHAEFYHGVHNEAPPDVSGKDVIIADFSYDRETLIQLEAEADSLLVLDHHKDRQEELEGLDFCTFDMEKSGATLAWEFCFPGEEVPMLIRHIEDRDLWNWKLKDSKEVCAALDSYSLTFETLDKLEQVSIAELAREGRSILRYQRQLVDRLVNHAYEVSIDGHKVLVVNTPVLQSEVAHELAKERTFGAIRYQLSDGRWKYSLRSNHGFDVSKVCHEFGGGGHPSASGMVIEGSTLNEVRPVPSDDHDYNMLDL